MQLSPALRDALRHLMGVEDPAPDDLIRACQELSDSLASAVESLLSVAVSMPAAGVPVRLTIAAHDDVSQDVRSSLVLRLPSLNGATLTVLAGQAGALDQLGADLPALLDIHRGRVMMNSLVGVSPVNSGEDLRLGIEAASVVNQSLGMLLGEEGMLPEEGLAHLEKSAEAASTTVAEEARRVLRAARRLD